MRKTHRTFQIINWGVAIFLAWFFGRVFLWSILVFLIRYDIKNYDAVRALYGMISLIVLSVSLSVFRDVQSKSKTISIVDNINANSRTKLIELLVFGSRIALIGYIYTYWVKQGSYLLLQKDTIIVQNLFTVLLALGTGVALITAFSGYLIILEPWRIFIIKINDRLKYRLEILLGIGRAVTIFIINLLFLWFYTPQLETKLPSVLTVILALIIMTKFQIPYYKTQKLRS